MPCHGICETCGVVVNNAMFAGTGGAVVSGRGQARTGGPSLNIPTTHLTPRDPQDISGIVAMLRAVEVAGMKVEAFEDFVVGHGELWSARMMASRMGQMGVDVEFMDAREVIVVKPTETGADVDVLFAESNAKLDAWGKAHGVPKVVVCTGFVARNQDGRITTLKRNGSDYSATIMGALLQARNITIWTDVNGVYSADPRKVRGGG